MRRQVAIGHLKGLAIEVRGLGLDATLYADRRLYPGLLVGDGTLAEWVEAVMFQFRQCGGDRMFGTVEDPALTARAIRDWLAANREGAAS
jgi:hypothetical protein